MKNRIDRTQYYLDVAAAIGKEISAAAFWAILSTAVLIGLAAWIISRNVH